MTLRTKLLGALGIVLASAVLSSISSLVTIKRLSEVTEINMNRSAKVLTLVGDLSAATMEIRFVQRGVVLWAVLGKMDDSDVQVKQYGEVLSRTQSVAVQMRPLLLNDEDRARLDNYEESLRGFKDLLPDVKRARDKKDFQAAGDILRTRTRPFALAMADDTTRLRDSQRQSIAAGMEQIQSMKLRSWWIQSGTILGLLALGTVLWFIVRGLVIQLRRVGGDVFENARQVAAAAGEISTASNKLAQNASREAAFLEETSASVEEITSIARRNAESSESAAGLMARVDQDVSESKASLDLMVASIANINTSSEKVARIIKVIDEIAFQTNILALNAAVEAARAGEAGMGFAVVADEVRNLAQRSAQAAKDTAALIEESIRHSRQGRDQLQAVAAASHQITQSTAGVKTLVDEVSLSSKEQTRGTDQISKAILQLQQLTVDTAASAEEGASASEELNAQAETLQATTRDLHAVIGE